MPAAGGIDAAVFAVPHREYRALDMAGWAGASRPAVLDANGVGNVWNIAAALLYAVDPDGDPSTDDGAQIINLSLGTLNRTRIFDTLSKLISCSDVVSADPALDVSDAGYAGDQSRCSRKSGALIVAMFLSGVGVP